MLTIHVDIFIYFFSLREIVGPGMLLG
jgi:hypothetical protein